MKAKGARTMAITLLCGLALARATAGSEPGPGQPAVEPDYRTANIWWSELPKKWTPVGWKDHLFRYNVLFNGAIVAEPHVNRRTAAWAGQGLLLWPALANPQDEGTIRQGWDAEHDAPVLWTDWSGSAYGNARSMGIRFRQDVFAHVPGSGDVRTGSEPLFAWVRLAIQGVDAKPGLPKTYTFPYKMHGPAIGRSMVGASNLSYKWQPYPRRLSFRPAAAGSSWGVVTEPDGTIRLAAACRKGCRIEFHASGEDVALHIEFDVQPGSCADLLLPMIPTFRDQVEKEWTLGYDGALAESDAYWRRLPVTAATVDVPEKEVTLAIRHYLKMAEVIAEKDPSTGDCCTLTGAWTYANVWSTPNSMLLALLLDPLGYHPQAERYLAVFAKHQGQTVPPGKTYQPHPGYLGTPKVYQAINWLSDNGALLWAFSQHALLSGDKQFIEAHTPTIIKSCEWIRDARKVTGHGGIEGILPGAVATDERKEVQSIWNDGWNYKGLTTAVRLLKRIRHPRAGEFEAEAKEYREAFQRAYREVAAQVPMWTDRRGNRRIRAPRNVSGDATWGLDHAFYLDVGPLFLVFSGLLDADDPLMQSARLWFREGPPRESYQDNGNCWQPPSLQHEISSCEPCYSWVYFHSWQLADRPKYLEGMYSLFAGASSQQTYTVCETRGGITAVTPCLPAVWLARLAAIDDQIRDGELHLLRLMPLAWLRPGQEARFENLPTEYGVVTLRAGLSSDGRALEVAFQPRYRTPPARAVLHIPPIPGLAAVRLNGQLLAWDQRQESLTLP